VRPSSLLGVCAWMLDVLVVMAEDVAHKLDRAGL
jgi:hypothetical protein